MVISLYTSRVILNALGVVDKVLDNVNIQKIEDYVRQ